jgi:putative transposase
VVRDRVRGFIQAMIEGELGVTLERPRYGRHPQSSSSASDGRVTRSLAAEPIVRLILDGTVVDVRLDRKATAISLLSLDGRTAARPLNRAAIGIASAATNIGLSPRTTSAR